MLRHVKEGGFLLTRENIDDLKQIEEFGQRNGMNIIMIKKYAENTYILLRKKVELPKKTVVIHVSNDEFDWVENMKKVMTEELEKNAGTTVRIIFVSEGNFESGRIFENNFTDPQLNGEAKRN